MWALKRPMERLGLFKVPGVRQKMPGARLMVDVVMKKFHSESTNELLMFCRSPRKIVRIFRFFDTNRTNFTKRIMTIFLTRKTVT